MAIVELLDLYPFLLIILCLAIGLVIGSFLNVVIHRLPVMMHRTWHAQCCEILGTSGQAATGDGPAAFKTFNLATPGSHCPRCNHLLSPWENIPLISYVYLGGKCSSCKQKISRRYPGVELFTGLLSALIASGFGLSWLTPALLLFTWSLVVLAWIDFDHRMLPDEITIPLLWSGLLFNALLPGLQVSLYDAVLGAIIGYLSLWSFHWIYKLLTGRDGLGYGDFKLMAALGAWMGWQSLLLIIFLSSIAGGLLGILLIAFAGKNRQSPIPYGPFLCGAGFIVMVWGTQITDWYFNTLLGQVR